jgi:hypothetical protein
MVVSFGVNMQEGWRSKDSNGPRYIEKNENEKYPQLDGLVVGTEIKEIKNYLLCWSLFESKKVLNGPTQIFA